MVATPSRFLTLNKVTFLQNTATESNPRAGARLGPEQRLPGARESLRTRPGCGSPCHTNSPAPARVPQEGGGFPGSAGPRVGGAGQGSGVPGKGPTPGARPPTAPAPAHLRDPALRAAGSPGKCPLPGFRKLLGRRPPARTSRPPARARPPALLRDPRGRSPARVAQAARPPPRLG